MRGLNYRILPIFILAFLRVFLAVSIGLAIPLYYSSINLNPEIIGLILSSNALSYLFSPFLFKKIPDRIGHKHCLIISAGGFLIIYLIFQFLLTPFWSFLLLFIDGILLAFFWPVLAGALSTISNYDEIHENDSIKNKLLKNYSFSWNVGGLFAFLFGTILLLMISDLLIIFNIAFFFALSSFIIVFFFEEPMKRKETPLDNTESSHLSSNFSIKKAEFPLYIPLFLIVLYSLCVGAIGLIFPLKSNFLEYAFYTTYLFFFLRLVAQTLTITFSISLSLKTLKKFIPFLALSVSTCFFLMGINENLILFGFLFILFGVSISVFYGFSFKLIVYLNTTRNTSKYSFYFETIVGLGFWLAPIINGFLAATNINLAFFFMAFLMLGGLGGFLILRNKLKIV